MLLLIQIALTVCAWRRGWGARALLPWGAAFAIDFLAAFGAGLSGAHSTGPLMSFAVIISLGMTIALIALSVAVGSAGPVVYPASTEHSISTKSMRARKSIGLWLCMTFIRYFAKNTLGK